MTDGHDPSEVAELLRFATDLAHQAGALTLEYFGGVVDHDAKGDGSPVTIADKKAEELIREAEDWQRQLIEELEEREAEQEADSD